MKVAISGIRPTSVLHMGNLFGMCTLLDKLQQTQLFFMIADLHSMTEKNVNIACMYYNCKVLLALNKSTRIYRQSDIRHLTDIMWILSNFVSSGELSRMTQFKSKTNPHCGFYIYPILMAADILSIDAEFVPVGQDQKQHLELTRNIAENINSYYHKNLFTLPETCFVSNVVIKNLIDGTKMSKTGNPEGCIFLNDSPESVTKKIRKAKTDSMKMPTNIEEIKLTRPEIYNLCLIYTYVTQKSFQDVEQDFADKNISEFKDVLSVEINNYLRIINQKINTITDEDVDRILHKTAEEVNNLVTKKYRMLQQLIFT